MIFKRITNICLSFLLVLSCMDAGAQPYFCVDKGAELKYVRRTVKNNKVKWIHTMTIDDVAYIADSSMIVNYSSYMEMNAAIGRMDTPAKMEVVIAPSGDVQMDIAATMMSVLKGFLWDGADVSAEGGVSILPYELVPGDSLDDSHGAVHALGMTMTADVTGRTVLRTETITTPAGTFDCVVVSEHKVEKGMMRNRVTTAHTWYARGVGMVRHDTYDKKMRLETSEVLESIAGIGSEDLYL